jgi:hypothetical protein
LCFNFDFLKVSIFYFLFLKIDYHTVYLIDKKKIFNWPQKCLGRIRIRIRKKYLRIRDTTYIVPYYTGILTKYLSVWRLPKGQMAENPLLESVEMCVPQGGDDCRVVRLGGGQAQQPDGRIQVKTFSFFNTDFRQVQRRIYFCKGSFTVLSRGLGDYGFSLNCRATENVDAHDMNFHAWVMYRSRKGKADDDILRKYSKFSFRLWPVEDIRSTGEEGD